GGLRRGRCAPPVRDREPDRGGDRDPPADPGKPAAGAARTGAGAGARSPVEAPPVHGAVPERGPCRGPMRTGGFGGRGFLLPVQPERRPPRGDHRGRVESRILRGRDHGADHQRHSHLCPGGRVAGGGAAGCTPRHYGRAGDDGKVRLGLLRRAGSGVGNPRLLERGASPGVHRTRRWYGHSPEAGPPAAGYADGGGLRRGGVQLAGWLGSAVPVHGWPVGCVRGRPRRQRRGEPAGRSREAARSGAGGGAGPPLQAGRSRETQGSAGRPDCGPGQELNRSMRAKKSLGQNCLVDPNLQWKIVDALEPGETDVVVEIGPGTGALTRHLAGRVKRLVAVELDDRLADALTEELGGTPGFELWKLDALRLDLRDVTDDPSVLKVIGNIPYNITTPLLFHLLDRRHRPGRLVVMVQKEVADRILAAPGSKEYGALSVGV